MYEFTSSAVVVVLCCSPVTTQQRSQELEPTKSWRSLLNESFERKGPDHLDERQPGAYFLTDRCGVSSWTAVVIILGKSPGIEIFRVCVHETDEGMGLLLMAAVNINIEQHSPRCVRFVSFGVRPECAGREKDTLRIS